MMNGEMSKRTFKGPVGGILREYRRTWGRAGYEVTDLHLAAHLVARGWEPCGVTKVTQSWPIVGDSYTFRERRHFLVIHFMESPDLLAAVKDYQESWEGWERVPITDQTKLSRTPRGKALYEALGLQKQRRAKHDQAHREPTRISNE